LNTLVHSIREVQGTNDEMQKYMYYINDGVYGSFNCVIYDHAVVRPELLKNYDGRETYECSIWGPTCDGLDQVCPKEFLPKLDMGDWMLFRNMGAYTLVAGGTFNGFPTPKVHYVASYDSFIKLKDFTPPEDFVTENVPIFMKAGVGNNRDAVGWVAAAADLVDPNGSCMSFNDVFDNKPSGMAIPCDSFLFEFPTNIEAQ